MASFINAEVDWIFFESPLYFALMECVPTLKVLTANCA